MKKKKKKNLIIVYGDKELALIFVREPNFHPPLSACGYIER